MPPLSLFARAPGTGFVPPRLDSRGAAPYLPGDAARDSTMARTNPLQFVQQVRTEVRKVVWPTRREVLLTTVMVLITATLTAIFFALVDLAIRGGLQAVLGIFG